MWLYTDAVNDFHQKSLSSETLIEGSKPEISLEGIMKTGKNQLCLNFLKFWNPMSVTDFSVCFLKENVFKNINLSLDLLMA